MEYMDKGNKRMNNEVNLNINENDISSFSPPTNIDIAINLQSKLKNSNNLNKCYNVNEDVIKGIPLKKKTIANNLFQKLDFDFIKEKKNKNGIQINEDYYKSV